MRWVMGYLSALCVLVLIVSQSVIFPTFFMPFYNRHYNRVDANTGLTIPESINMTHENLMYVTTELLNYMRGRRDTLEGLTAYASGRRVYGQNFFTDTEIRHMIDVRVLYERLYMVRNVSFFLLIALILGMILLKYKVGRILAKCIREVLVGFLIIAVIMTVIISLDFERSWDIFHYIFFRGDAAHYWRLTPYVDLMINMVPLHFFINISIFIGGLIAALSACVITSCSMYLYKSKDRGFD